MKMRRRHFLKMGAFQSAVLLSTRTAKTEADQRKEGLRSHGEKLSILQGMTDESTAEFSILTYRDQELAFYCMDESGRHLQVLQLDKIEFNGQKGIVQKIGIIGLQLNTSYRLRIFDTLKSKIVDEREFKALNLYQKKLDCAICSCMNDARHDGQIWRALSSRKPDLILFVGDSVYADDGISSGIATPAHLWKRFCEARETLDIYFQKELIPILATWDDHDFGMDDSDSINYPYTEESQQNFQAFYAQSGVLSDKLLRGPGISHAISVSNHLIVLMDDRSFRLPKGVQNRYSHWGQEQEEWLMDILAAHQGPAFICNGSQIFPQMIFKESFSGDHEIQFTEVMKRLSLQESRLLFVSGDVHFSEVSKIEKSALGYLTYEITSSSIHSATFPGILEIVKNPRRISATSQRNFVILEVEARGLATSGKAISYGKNGNKIFETEISNIEKS